MEPEASSPPCYEDVPPPAVSPVSTASSSPPPGAPGEDYLRMLRRERRTLDAVPGAALSLAHKLITQEMERIQGGGRPPAGGVLDLSAASHQASTTNHGRSSDDRRIADITKEKPIKVSVRVLVPAKEHPKFNFVGKLLGPKGNSLKRLQEETMTKMAILGRGSMKDKHKEEELRGSGDPRYSHLNEELHVEVTAFAAPAEAHARIAYALAEIRRFLVPDYNDEIRQEQMREMQLMQNADQIELEEVETEAKDPPQTPPPQVSPPQAAKQEGRVYVHPSLRAISRIPPPGTVYRASILSRLRPPQARMLMAAAAAAGPTGQSLATGAPTPVAPQALHHKRALFPFLARFGGSAGVMLGGDESVLGLYDGYSGAGYNLLEEGIGEEMMEDISQDSMKGAAAAVAAAAAAAELRGAADSNGTPSVAASSLLKAERGRFRHDPYGRYAAKLPL